MVCYNLGSTNFAVTEFGIFMQVPSPGNALGLDPAERSFYMLVGIIFLLGVNRAKGN
jgi:hypothetical protein